MNPKYQAKRLWLLNSLNYKVKQEVDKKVSYILNNPEHLNVGMLEDISKMLSLEWKLNNQTYELKNQLNRIAQKAGVQQ